MLPEPTHATGAKDSRLGLALQRSHRLCGILYSYHDAQFSKAMTRDMHHDKRHTYVTGPQNDQKRASLSCELTFPLHFVDTVQCKALDTAIKICHM